MALPAFRAAGTGVFCANNVADPSTLACTAPAGRSVGDLLLCVTMCRSITATVATPSGWNLVSGFPKASTIASGGSVYVFSRIADGTSADNCSPSWSGVTTGTSGDSSGAVILAYSGLTETIDSVGTFSGSGAQTSVTTFNGLTTAVNNSMVICAAMKLSESAGQTSTVTTFTERYDGSTTSGTGHIEEISDLVQATASTVFGPVVTWSNTASARTFGGSFAFKSIMPTGAAALSLVIGLTAAGVRKTFGAAARSETVTLAAAGVRKALGAAARSETVTFVAAGVRKAFGAAARSETVTLTAAGVRKALGAAARAQTIALTAAGFKTTSGTAARPETVTLSAAGVRKTLAAAARPETITFTAAGTRTQLGAANEPLTLAFTADGHVSPIAGAAMVSTFTSHASGVRETFGAASLNEHDAFTASGYVTKHSGAALTLSIPLHASSYTTKLGAAHTGLVLALRASAGGPSGTVTPGEITFGTGNPHIARGATGRLVTQTPGRLA